MCVVDFAARIVDVTIALGVVALIVVDYAVSVKEAPWATWTST